MMRNWCWLLISLAGIAAAEPPPRLEMVLTMTRNGSTMAEVTERLEYAGGNYQLTETWKGKGIYALLGSARRVSQGSIEQGTLRPREFFDEVVGRERVRVPAGEFDAVKLARRGEDRESAEFWLAAERNYIPVRLLVVEKDGTRYEQVATRISP